MFNSLNSTGLPLSDADVISAQLYSKANENEAVLRLFNDKWKSIKNLTDKLRTCLKSKSFKNSFHCIRNH